MLGKAIKDYLDENGTRYSHIAEKAGIPMNTLSTILNGKRKIEAVEYFKLCDAMNVPLDTFSKVAEVT